MDFTLTPQQQEAYDAMAGGDNVFVTGPAGTGKCLAYDTPVRMHDTTTRMVQDIRNGDVLLGDDGTPRVVSGVAAGRGLMYRVEHQRGDVYTVNSAHILSLRSVSTCTYDPVFSTRYPDGEYIVHWGDESGYVCTRTFASLPDAQRFRNTLPATVDAHVGHCVRGLHMEPELWRVCFRALYASYMHGYIHPSDTRITGIYRWAPATYYGFQLDGNHRFVLGSGVVTHNTAVIKKFVADHENTGSGTPRTIAITSTTGTSALLLGGSTLHSYLGIGLAKGGVHDIVAKIRTSLSACKRWANLSCLVIDEVSMLSSETLERLEKVARVMRKRPASVFGGIQLIFSGDFLQLPCIGSSHFAFETATWDRCIQRTVYMHTIVRQRHTSFQACLNDVRLGRITPAVTTLLSACVGKDVADRASGVCPTKLYCRNVDVDMVNNAELDKLARDGRQFLEYTMQFRPNPDASTRFTQIAFDKHKKASIVPENLQLCLDAQVMLCHNVDVENGLANGSRGVVVRFDPDTDCPVVRFMNGSVRTIDPVWTELEDTGMTLGLVQQVPLKPAYAITIHKSQGCTIDCVQLDLGNVFEYGQAYVALSRVRDVEGLSILSLNYDLIQADPVALAYYQSLL